MILIEFGIELIKFLIQKYMGLGRQYSRQVKYRKYFSLQICMPIPKRKVFLSTDAKIRIILTFADRFHSYFGKMFGAKLVTIALFGAHDMGIDED